MIIYQPYWSRLCEICRLAKTYGLKGHFSCFLYFHLDLDSRHNIEYCCRNLVDEYIRHPDRAGHTRMQINITPKWVFSLKVARFFSVTRSPKWALKTLKQDLKSYNNNKSPTWILPLRKSSGIRVEKNGTFEVIETENLHRLWPWFQPRIKPKESEGCLKTDLEKGQEYTKFIFIKNRENQWW